MFGEKWSFEHPIFCLQRKKKHILTSIFWPKSSRLRLFITEYSRPWIDVGQEINIEHGKFGKNLRSL